MQLVGSSAALAATKQFVRAMNLRSRPRGERERRDAATLNAITDLLTERQTMRDVGPILILVGEAIGAAAHTALYV